MSYALSFQYNEAGRDFIVMFVLEEQYKIQATRIHSHIPPHSDRLSSTLSSFGNFDKKRSQRRGEAGRRILFKSEVLILTRLDTTSHT